MEKNFVVSGLFRMCEKVLDFIILGTNFPRTQKLRKLGKILQIIVAFALHGLVTVWLWEKVDAREILAPFYALVGLIAISIFSMESMTFDDSSILSILLRTTAN